MNDLLYFWTFLKASLLSTGGMGNLPILHSSLTTAGVATNRQFAEALAIGQIAPGPNGLWTVSLGYLTRGLRGSLMASAGIILPPFAVLAVRKLYGNVQDHPLAVSFMRGLTCALVGVSIVILLTVFHSVKISVASISIAVCAGLLMLSSRAPVVAIFLAAAIVGIAAGR